MVDCCFYPDMLEHISDLPPLFPKLTGMCKPDIMMLHLEPEIYYFCL